MQCIHNEAGTEKNYYIIQSTCKQATECVICQTTQNPSTSQGEPPYVTAWMHHSNRDIYLMNYAGPTSNKIGEALTLS